MARLANKGTVTATTSGVEIPVVSNLVTGNEHYFIRLRVTDAAGDAAFVPGGITPVFLQAATVAPSSGTAAVAWELWAESDGFERDA